MASSIVTAAGASRPPDGRDARVPRPAHDWDEFSDLDIASLCQDMDRNGYAVVEHYVSPAELERLRCFVQDTVAMAGGTYTTLSGPAPVAGTALEKMASSPALRRVCTRIYEVATGDPAPDEPYHQILRCLTGSAGRRHSMIFHFDSYVLTVLLPIEVPPGNDSGDLIMLPNVRGIRRRYATNLVDKILLDNPLTQSVLRATATARTKRFVRIPMVPGNLYFFWGYRSIHTNAPCDADKIRATALFHYADPHRASRLKMWLRG